MPDPSRPLILAGMHRSGTSLVAAFLAALGVPMGERMLAADTNNRRGYFEDADFLAFQRRILQEISPANDGGHADWGWTESERLDRSLLARYAEEARALAAQRSGLWGFKDPRTTLLLDFWDEVLAGRPLYVLVYRFPWEVAESMQRLGAAVFLDHPEYAWRIWTFYNRHLLDFYYRHPGRCVLASANGLLRDPERFAVLLTGKLGLQLSGAPLDAVRDPGLFTSLPPGDPLMGLSALVHPEAARLLADLDAAADLPATGLWDACPPQGSRLRPEGPVDLSVVIPCFDQGELLIEAVASVERAAPERCELIIVDDGSHQPRTLEVLGWLREKGYCVISQPNAGLAGARNRGVRESRGRYVLPLDADNRLLPGFPAAAVQVFDAHPEVGVVYGDRLEMGARNQRVTVPELDLDTLLWANFIDACAALRREVWEQVGGYDPGADAWEDWDLWLSAAERGWRFHRLPDPTFEYRVRPGSMLAHAQREGIRRDVREHIYGKHRDLYREHWTGVLLAGHSDLLAVREGAEIFHRDRDRVQSDAERILAGLTAEREATAALTRERDSLAATREALRAEIDALNAELSRWRERVAAMEKTAAWRLRSFLLRLRKGG